MPPVTRPGEFPLTSAIEEDRDRPRRRAGGVIGGVDRGAIRGVVGGVIGGVIAADWSKWRSISFHVRVGAELESAAPWVARAEAAARLADNIALEL